jgi:hypothetical protein
MKSDEKPRPFAREKPSESKYHDYVQLKIQEHEKSRNQKELDCLQLERGPKGVALAPERGDLLLRTTSA